MLLLMLSEVVIFENQGEKNYDTYLWQNNFMLLAKQTTLLKEILKN